MARRNKQRKEKRPSQRRAHRIEKMKLRNERKQIAQAGKIAKWQSKADTSKYQSESDIVAYNNGITPVKGKGLEFASELVDTAVSAFGKPAGQSPNEIFSNDESYIEQPTTSNSNFLLYAAMGFGAFLILKKR